jgi:hypothetical protein
MSSNGLGDAKAIAVFCVPGEPDRISRVHAVLPASGPLLARPLQGTSFLLLFQMAQVVALLLVKPLQICLLLLMASTIPL